MSNTAQIINFSTEVFILSGKYASGIPIEALSELSGAELKLYIALCSYANHKNQCYPKRKDLAAIIYKNDWIQISPQKQENRLNIISKHLKSLVSKNWLEIMGDGRYGKPNDYIVKYRYTPIKKPQGVEKAEGNPIEKPQGVEKAEGQPIEKQQGVEKVEVQPVEKQQRYPIQKVEGHPVEKQQGHPIKKVEGQATIPLQLTNTDNHKHIKESQNSLAKSVIDYLNEKTGLNFKYTSSDLKFILARFKENFSVDDLKLIVDHKVNEWLGNLAMSEYLRPSTLFGTKANGYLAIATLPKKAVSVTIKTHLTKQQKVTENNKQAVNNFVNGGSKND